MELDQLPVLGDSPDPLFKRVLFVAAASPNLCNVMETVSCVAGLTHRILHMDGPDADRSMDELLYRAVGEFRPDLLIFIPSIVVFDRTPTRSCFEAVRRVFDLPIVHIFTDLAKPVWHAVAMELAQVADVAVSVDGIGTKFLDTARSNAVWCELWTPVSPPDPGPLERNIDVSMIGSLAGFPHRGECIEHLRRNGIEVATGGGQDSSYGLSSAEYYRLLHRSKIIINIARAGYRNLAPDGSLLLNMKGRVMEALACGALLLESRNDATAQYLEDGADYVSFGDNDDLVRKIEFFLADEPARAAIAGHGRRTFLERYTARIFWNHVFGAVAYAQSITDGRRSGRAPGNSGR